MDPAPAWIFVVRLHAQTFALLHFMSFMVTSAAAMEAEPPSTPVHSGAAIWGSQLPSADLEIGVPLAAAAIGLSHVATWLLSHAAAGAAADRGPRHGGIPSNAEAAPTLAATALERPSTLPAVASPLEAAPQGAAKPTSSQRSRPRRTTDMWREDAVTPALPRARDLLGAPVPQCPNSMYLERTLLSIASAEQLPVTLPQFAGWVGATGHDGINVANLAGNVKCWRETSSGDCWLLVTAQS